MTPQQIDQEIYIMATQNGFVHEAALLIVAQARLESTDYSSNVFKNNYNAYGMKYIGQQLATRGTKAPASELSASCKAGGTCVNNDFYAKYTTPTDSARDVITRLYEKTRAGVTPEALKKVKTAQQFADLLKKRSYFGVTAAQYASGLMSKLKKINVVPVQTLPGVTIDASKKKFNYLIIGGAALITLFLFIRKKR